MGNRGDSGQGDTDEPAALGRRQNEHFGDASLAAAVVDRLLHHGDVFDLKGPSWRVPGKTADNGAIEEALASA